MEPSEALFQYLKNLDIAFVKHEHPPVHTIEEAWEYWQDIDAQHCKNLFFRNQKGNQHYLVVLPHDCQVPIKTIQERLQLGKLSFASERRLNKYMNLSQGAVSPFGLINDTENHIKVYIDKKIQHAKHVAFHPNDNEATISLSSQDFFHFMDQAGNTYAVKELCTD